MVNEQHNEQIEESTTPRMTESPNEQWTQRINEQMNKWMNGIPQNNNKGRMKINWMNGINVSNTHRTPEQNNKSELTSHRHRNTASVTTNELTNNEARMNHNRMNIQCNTYHQEW